MINFYVVQRETGERYMKKMVIPALIAFISFQTYVFAQDERLVPSYDEDSGFIRDYPDVDINVYPFVNTWKNSKVEIGHGGFAEQAIFTRGNPVNPPRKGAVLKYIKAYNHGFLYGNEKTKKTKHGKEQVIFYVMKEQAYLFPQAWNIASRAHPVLR